jgi:protein-S-isoprenylcysteine O-methyltransferase Ste14
MAGAADAGRSLVVVARPTTAQREHWEEREHALRARIAALPASVVGLALGSGALAAHFALWGDAAPWGRAEVTGGAIALFGLAVALWAAALFRAAGTPIAPSDRPAQLIEEGPYRFSRHPMYAGTVLTLLGAAISLGVPLLALSAALFGTLMATAHVPHEEAQLARRFGGWHRDYAGSVRPWL